MTRRPRLARLGAWLESAPLRWRLAGPAAAAVLAAAVVLAAVRLQDNEERRVAAHLDLLLEYEAVSSLGDVSSPAEAAVVAALDEVSPDDRQAAAEPGRAAEARPPERQPERRGDLERLRSLPPERRAELVRKHRVFEQLPAAERRQLLERFRRFRELSPERRAELRSILAPILEASPRERARYVENLRRWRQLSAEERERARESLRKRRGGRGWIRRHPARDASIPHAAPSSWPPE